MQTTQNGKNTFKGKYVLRENKFLEINPGVVTAVASDKNLDNILVGIDRAKYYFVENDSLIIKFYNVESNNYGAIYFKQIR